MLELSFTIVIGYNTGPWCNYGYIDYIKEQAAWNKSSLLMKLQMQNAQTLQLSTKRIKTESIYKS
jgi:hypothetical protein